MQRSIWPLHRRKPRLLNERANRYRKVSASSLRNKLFIMLVWAKETTFMNRCCRFHWWFQIWNLIVSLVKSFGEFDVSPYKVIGAALACPRGFQRWPPSDWTCLKETLAVSSIPRMQRTDLCSRGDRSCQASLEERTRKDTRTQNAHLWELRCTAFLLNWSHSLSISSGQWTINIT